MLCVFARTRTLAFAAPNTRIYTYAQTYSMSAQKKDQFEDAPTSQSESSKGKVVFVVSNLPTFPESQPDASLLQDDRKICDSVPVLLPLKQPPPCKPVPTLLETSGVLTATEQFEMQAAVAYTIAHAKQSPVPRGLFAHNLARANSLLPEGRQALGIDEGQLYFATQYEDTPLSHTQTGLLGLIQQLLQ